MRRSIIAALALAASACESVRLRVDEPAAPVAPTPIDEVFPTTTEPASACAPGCAGGRACVAGECLPHWLPVPSPEVSGAEARVGHFAVWTGSEVIVWGGHNPNVPGDAGLYGDGFRFDPTRSEVRSLSLDAAPAARFADGGQTAVWTGREMIIWGGRTSAGEVTDGAAYLPASDRWVPIASVMAPRTRVTPVFTGAGVVLAGARGPDDQWRWEPSVGSWVQATRGGAVGASQPRRGHSAVWTGEDLLVWGGVDGAGRALADGWRFSPARRRARALGDAGALMARSQHTAVWAGSEMLVFGGVGGDGLPLGALASYVPATDAWRALAAEGAPSPRYDHVAVWTGRALLVWGGTDGVRSLDDGAAFDPWENTWTSLGRVAATGQSTAREGAAGVWTGRELIVIGGSDGRARIAPLGWRYQP